MSTSDTELRGLTDIEALRVELVVLRAMQKALAEGDVNFAMELARRHGQLLKAALQATTLYVNGHDGVTVPLTPH
jgi:hypothetical protein